MEVTEFLRLNWGWLAGTAGILGFVAMLALGRRFASVEDLAAVRTAIAAKAAAEDVRDMAKKLDELDRDVGLMGERMRHMPSADDVRRLDERVGAVGQSVAALKADVAAIAAKTSGQDAVLASINEQLGILTRHLLEAK